MMNDRGMTLLEVIVVVVVVGILVVILGVSVDGWIGRYKVESETKTMFGDLMNAKARAMGRNRIHFVTFPSTTQYAIYEDTNPAPDGNGTLETTGSSSDTLIMQKTTSYPIATALSPSSGNFTFTKDGLASKTGSIRLTSAVSPEYDCIQVELTRINEGRWNGSSCVSK